jgi:hypothetical protein
VIPNWLRKIATGRAVAISFLLWISYSAMILNWGPYPKLKASILQLPGEDLTATAKETHSKLVQLGERGRERYRRFLRLEVGNALITTAASTLLLAYALGRFVAPKSPAGLLVYLPVVAGVCELIESSFLALALSRFPDDAAAELRIASLATRLKILLGYIVVPILGILFAKLGLRALRARRSVKYP